MKQYSYAHFLESLYTDSELAVHIIRVTPTDRYVFVIEEERSAAFDEALSPDNPLWETDIKPALFFLCFNKSSLSIPHSILLTSIICISIYRYLDFYESELVAKDWSWISAFNVVEQALSPRDEPSFSVLSKGGLELAFSPENHPDFDNKIIGPLLQVLKNPIDDNLLYLSEMIQKCVMNFARECLKPRDSEDIVEIKINKPKKVEPKLEVVSSPVLEPAKNEQGTPEISMTPVHFSIVDEVAKGNSFETLIQSLITRIEYLEAHEARRQVTLSTRKPLENQFKAAHKRIDGLTSHLEKVKKFVGMPTKAEIEANKENEGEKC